ncbi:MAG: hypothetical protein CVV30_04585 [Methanomicrobiales archaeon HGW-Methanomicrobiales-1]|nr:MAG: hypothetical protein CVV30_04585 [Methanomicrobiales archaeon HGW-Methanomicrobiales-1]
MAPPAEKPIIPAGTYEPDQPASEETTIPTPIIGFVTIETPYVTLEPVSVSGTANPSAYTTLSPVTPIPEDYVVIYSINNQPFAYNKTAVSFDLKNPPMRIDFTLSVTNTTRNIEGDSRTLTNEWTSFSVSNFDPTAYFEVTVREKASGKIILQDGFGQSKQYGTENPRHLKILTRGDYLIEFGGNKVFANINLSVKREGNINQSVE